MKKTIIIAEIGVNHNGSIKLAKKMILEAKRCGADYVKFQTFKADEVFSKNAPKAKYQIKKNNKKEKAIEMAKKLELSLSDHFKIYKFCRKKKIKYSTTFHDLYSLKSAKNFKLDFIKVPSGEINNFPYLKECIKLKKTIILSTGASFLYEVKNAIDYLIKNGFNKNKLIILHCNSAYPTPIENVNLSILNLFKKKFNIKVGYSDHTNRIEVPALAVCLGAQVIEKHFTINQKFVGPDHKSSLNPTQFSSMVKLVRDAEIILGKNKKIVTKSEKSNRSIIRKSIFSKKNISKGDRFTKDNISIKRPQIGLKPIKYFSLLGKLSKKNYKKDQPIYG